VCLVGDYCDINRLMRKDKREGKEVKKKTNADRVVEMGRIKKSEEERSRPGRGEWGLVAVRAEHRTEQKRKKKNWEEKGLTRKLAKRATSHLDTGKRVKDRSRREPSGVGGEAWWGGRGRGEFHKVRSGESH